MAGYSSGDFSLTRYNANGSLDTSFDGDGKLTTDFGSGGDAGYSVTLQPDGKILVAGEGYISSSGYSGFALARYTANGSLDTSFDGDGKLTTDFGSSSLGNSITLQPDGKILVTGYSGSASGTDSALARYNADGSLDTSFDGDGKLTNDFGWGDSYKSITLQPDGKILVAGNAPSIDSDFFLARYNANGSLDTSFDGDGKLTTDFGSGGDAGYSVTLQPDGKILVAGTAYISSSGYSVFALARYTANGSLDTSFDGDGKLTTDFGSSSDGSSITLQPDGKILVTGTSGFGSASDFALARYNTDGSLDTSFGPVINTLSNTPTFTEPTYYGYTNAVILDPFVQILDPELAATGQYNGATLTLQRHSGANVQDVFSAATNALTILIPGSYFSIDGTTIGRVTTNSAGTLTLTFNANATQSLVNKAMQQIAYANTSDAPPASVQIDWTFNDGNTGAEGEGGAMSVAGSTTVQITATNDYPVLNQSLVDQSLSANTPFSYTFPADAFTDPDLESLNYSIRMSDGTGVPPWLSFTPATRTFSGIPSAADVGDLDIVVTATDSANATASYTVRLSVSATPIADTLAPTVTTFSPVDDATGVTESSDIMVTFSEAIARGTGNVVLTTTAGALVATYDAATSANLSISGSTLTINPTTDLSPGTAYKVEFAAGSIKDLSGNNYAGTTSYNFTTLDATAPTVNTFSPADEATGVAVGSNIVLTFSEAIARGPGNIILKTNTGTVIASYDAATSANLSISGSTLTINPSADLSGGTAYKVEFDAGSIKDLSGNNYAGTTSYNFTTINVAPTLATPAALSLTDTTSADVFTETSATLLGQDADGGTLTYGIVGASPFGVGFVSKLGAYGSLIVNTTTGAYTFAPNATAIEARKTDTSETFTVTVSDGTSSANATLTININGANDLTTFSGSVSGNVTEDGTQTATGTLTAADRDTGDASIAAQSNAAGTYGSFSINASGLWSYTLNNSAANVQALNTGSSVTDTFAVATAGGASQNVVITIAGITEGNTAPTLATPASTTYTDTSADDTFSPTTGNLLGSDPDAGTTLSYSISGGTDAGETVSLVGTLGTLSVTKTTGAYTFAPDDTALEALTANSSETFTVTVSDGADLVSADYTINLTAANDTPTLAQEQTDQNASSGIAFSYAVPTPTFTDRDANETFSYSATLSSGAALPSWLSFDSITGSFSGTPSSSDVGILDIRLGVSDSGGLSASDTFTLTVTTTNAISGIVADGYIAGAAIYVDANGDGIADPTENTGVVTDASGNFNLQPTLTGALIAIGGTNIDTGLPNTLQLAAPQGSSVINPLTTLVQLTATQQGISASQAQAQVQAALGISANVDLTQYDPLAQSANDATALAVQQAATQIATLVTLAPQGDTTFSSIAAAVANAGNQPLDLSSASVLQSILPTEDTATLQRVADINQAIADTGNRTDIATVQETALNDSNDAPVLLIPLPDQSTPPGAVYAWTFAANTFTDLDVGDTLSYSAVQTNGAGLPSWLLFDAATRSFSGMPASADVGILDIRITASDTSNASTSDIFRITVAAGNTTPTGANLVAAIQSSTGVTLNAVLQATLTARLQQLFDTGTYSALAAAVAIQGFSTSLKAVVDANGGTGAFLAHVSAVVAALNGGTEVPGFGAGGASAAAYLDPLEEQSAGVMLMGVQDIALM